MRDFFKKGLVALLPAVLLVPACVAGGEGPPEPGP